MFPSYANNFSTDSRQEIDIFPSEAMKDAPASDFECIRRVVCIFLYKTALAIDIFSPNLKRE